MALLVGGYWMSQRENPVFALFTHCYVLCKSLCQRKEQVHEQMGSCSFVFVWTLCHVDRMKKRKILHRTLVHLVNTKWRTRQAGIEVV